MRLLTRDAILLCDHQLGYVQVDPLLQGLVTVAGRAVLVANDPEQKKIVGCPHSVPLAGILPCTLTLPVRHGYSPLLRIDGRRVCLDGVTGYTSGTPPGTVDYFVSHPGQTFVAER